jgi:hypothetical protein
VIWSEKILDLFKHLEITTKLPNGVVVLNPYQDAETFDLCRKFYTKYYNDDLSRSLIIGINPGRFGGGLTGIPFTDPLILETYCGISNTLQKRAEISSDFIYQVIDELGGLENFYSRFYFSSVSPLGFTKDNKNLNYYDIPALQSALIPFIKKFLFKQVAFGLNTEVCFVLGEGKNYMFMNKLNQELKIFNRLIPLSHPRFIMQYKKKQLKSYIQEYKKKLSI